jgi:alkanesulfonate monooxygenase SsuD/methylene tetrahydromethanopterin reductase-like flavin-dependent oxidoreductase (luciferase family)
VRPELAAVAQAADRAGFFYVGVCDHIAIPSEKAPEVMGTEWWDTVATLAWLAAASPTARAAAQPRVRAVVPPPPGRWPRPSRRIDVVSGGRVIMGVGAGHVEAEFDLLGLPFAKRGACSTSRSTPCAPPSPRTTRRCPARVWPAADLGQHPRAVQEDGPPIWVGGSSPAALRRAAQRGDGWLPQGPVTPEIIEEIKALRDKAGRHDAFDFGALVGPVYVGDADWDFGAPTLAGSPDKIAHVLRKFSAMGVGPGPGAPALPLARRAHRPDRPLRRRGHPPTRLRSRRPFQIRSTACCSKARSPSCPGSVPAWAGTSPSRSPERAPSVALRRPDRSAGSRPSPRRSKRSASGRSRWCATSPTRPSAPRRRQRGAAAELGRLDILVNNAYDGGDAKAFMDADFDAGARPSR